MASQLGLWRHGQPAGPPARVVGPGGTGPGGAARPDMLIDGDDQAHINELELIEPALYGQFDPDFPARFRTALRDYLAGENP